MAQGSMSCLYLIHIQHKLKSPFTLSSFLLPFTAFYNFFFPLPFFSSFLLSLMPFSLSFSLYFSPDYSIPSSPLFLSQFTLSGCWYSHFYLISFVRYLVVSFDGRYWPLQVIYLYTKIWPLTYFLSTVISQKASAGIVAE